MSTPFRLQVPRPLVEEMLAHAQAQLPNECVGLLAGEVVEEEGGRQGRVVARYPLVNAEASPVEYLSDGDSMLAAHKDMRRRGLDVLAIYHSHPTSQPVPSRKDLDRNYYGTTVVHFIISLAGPEPVLRGWWLTDTDYREAEWDRT